MKIVMAGLEAADVVKYYMSDLLLMRWHHSAASKYYLARQASDGTC